MTAAPPSGPLLFREIRFHSLEQAAEDSNAIDQKTAVGRIVAPALADTAVHPQTIPAGQLVLLRQGQHAIIHLVERLGPHEPFQIVLGGVVGHGMIVDPHPALIGFTIPHRFLGLPIGPFLPAAQKGQTIGGLQRDGMASSSRGLVMCFQITLEERQQLRIIEDPLQFLQHGVARWGRFPVDRTFVTLYNQCGPPRERIVLRDTLLYPRWPPRFNSQFEISDKN
jgi:hypothetical protein